MLFSATSPQLQQFKIIKLVTVLHDVPLDLAAHGPCHKVLHASRNQVRRVRNSLSSHAHVALLDHLGRSLDILGHAQSGHKDGQSAARKGADGNLILDGGKFGGGVKDTHVVELVEEKLFVLAAGCILGREER